MSDAEPMSTSSTSLDLENANGQASPVAVSEENLAALLRATLRSAEPEAERLTEAANTPPAIGANESSTGAIEPRADRPAAVTSPTANVIESRLALFAAVKENRSATSRSGITPATPLLDQSPTRKVNTTAARAEQFASLPVSAPPKVAAFQVKLPETAPPTPAPVASFAAPSRVADNQNPSDKILGRRLVIGLVVAAVIAIAGASVFFARAHSSRFPQEVVSAPKASVPVQLRVELLGNGLIDVRWNPQSTPIAQARDGRLVITEPNQQPRTLALGIDQLKTGHLTYQSAAESVEFDLEVVDGSGAIAKESILAMQAPSSSPPLPGAPPQTARGQVPTAKPQNVPTPVAPAEVPQPRQPSVRTFVAPPTQRNTEQRAILDAPPTLTNGPVTPPEVGLPIPLAVISPPPKKDAAAQQQVRVESNIQAANLIKKVLPNYPQIARATRIQGIVRFTARIGKDGRILNLKFTSGPPVLVDSASAAVKQWVYRPTLLNGEPVEVITQIDVNFTLHEVAH
jgi:periplasmic protein TonB